MSNHFKTLCCAAVLGAVAVGNAQVTVSVIPSIAPNGFGSPSYAAYVSNAIYAIQNNLSSYGTPGTPSYYQRQTTPVDRKSVIATGFKSWMGVADPVAPYENELGNRMHFGLHIMGNGTKFSLSQLSFVGNSTGDANGLGFSFGAGSYTYNDDYIGIIYGSGGGSPTFVTGGSNTQLVDEVVGRGSGNAYAAYVTAGLTNQQAIDAAANDPTAQWTSFTGTYSLDLGGSTVTGSGSFNAAAPVPEPFTMSLGIAGAGLFLRRRLKAKRA